MPRTPRFEPLEPRLPLSAGSVAPGSVSAADVAAIAGGVYRSDLEAPTAIVGVQLELFDQQGQVIAAATTDAAGVFVFDNLPPGFYAVRQLQPEGMFDAGIRIGAGGGQILSDNLIGEIGVAAGQWLAGYEFFESAAPPSAVAPPPLTTHHEPTANFAAQLSADNVVLRLDAPAPRLSEPMPGRSALLAGETTGVADRTYAHRSGDFHGRGNEPLVDAAPVWRTGAPHGASAAPRRESALDPRALDSLLTDEFETGSDDQRDSPSWLTDLFERRHSAPPEGATLARASTQTPPNSPEPAPAKAPPATETPAASTAASATVAQLPPPRDKR